MKNSGFKKLSISIVNYNTGAFLQDCLKSISEVMHEAEIIVWVVDNASTDNSIIKAKSKYPQFNYIFNSENLGFGRAHNQVLKNVNTEFILILNPDTLLKKGVIKTMLKFMEDNPYCGAATCKIILPDGKSDLTAHRGFPTPLASLMYFIGNDSLYHLTDKNMEEVHQVDAISGSFFLTRKSVLDKVGLFDEGYFMYAEDIDLCFRIKELGYKVMYVPTVSIVHFKGVSSGLKRHSLKISTATLETRQRSLNAFYQTMKIFYKKHYEDNYPFFINWLVYLGIAIKWTLAKRQLVV